MYSSYQTIVTRPYLDRLSEIRRELDKINALNRTDHLIVVDETLRMVTPHAEAVPSFNVPFVYEGIVYADARPFYARGAAHPTRNPFDYAGLKIRASLTHMWEVEPKTLEAHTVPTSCIFGHWIADAIAARYDCDVVDRSIIQVLATLYYITRFYCQVEQGPGKYEELRVLAMRALSARGAGMPMNTIEPILDDAMVKGLMEEPSEFTLAALTRLITERVSFQMGAFTENTLMRITAGGSWIGWEANTIALMALEYPPCLIFMIGTAQNSTSYRNKTRVGQVVNRNRRLNGLDGLSRLINSLEV